MGGWVGTYLVEGRSLQAFAPLNLIQDGVEGGDGGEEGGLGFVPRGLGWLGLVLWGGWGGLREGDGRVGG